MILEEAGRREEAVAELDKRADKIVDAVGMREQRARLHLHLGNVDKATAVYRELLAGMPDNYRYHEVGRCSLTLGWKHLTPRLLSGTFRHFQRLKLKHDKPLSNVAFNCNLRHCHEALHSILVGRCRLNSACRTRVGCS